MHRLIEVHVPDRVRAAVVVLHGGASRRGSPPVSPTQLSVLRMIPVARRIAAAGRAGGDGLAVFRLLNSHRGWDTTTTPDQDAGWAIAQVADRFGDVPVGLVGHSLGGRAALLAGAAPAVRSVVALNPWLYGTEDPDLTGRAVLVVHGSDDRIASPERARQVVARLERRTDVELRVVEDGKHAMLLHGRAFEEAAASFTVAALLGRR